MRPCSITVNGRCDPPGALDNPNAPRNRIGATGSVDMPQRHDLEWLSRACFLGPTDGCPLSPSTFNSTVGGLPSPLVPLIREIGAGNGCAKRRSLRSHPP